MGYSRTEPNGFIAELTAVARKYSYRDPMFDALRAGALPREAIKLWALQAMKVVEQFTRFISAIHANCPYRDAQQLLAENLWEEHGRGKAPRDHLSLVQRLAASLGATEEEIRNKTPLPETEAYIAFCLELTRNRSFVEGLTAIGVGIESYIPVFFGVMAEALEKTFGLKPEDLEFLRVHVGEDDDHARRSMEMIEKYALSDDDRERAKTALRDTLVAKRRFGEALYHHCVSVSNSGLIE
jgi:pyrroloquinoline quinone (PQQ) biosynthesis protein C